MSTPTPTPTPNTFPSSRLLHDLLRYIHDEKRPVDDPQTEEVIQALHQRIFPRIEGRPNLGLFFAGRVIGYEDNLAGLLETMESLSRRHNLYIFTSINGFFDIYHAKFCKIFGIGPDQRFFSIFRSVSRYHNFRRNRFTNIYNTTSMWYNTNYCMRLMYEYLNLYGTYCHIVMKYRTEVIHAEKPIEIGTTVEPNTIYIPHGFNHTGLNDQVAYGTYDSMFMYARLIFDVDSYTKIPGFFFHPETNLQNHLLEQKVHVERIHFPYYFRNQLSTDHA